MCFTTGKIHTHRCVHFNGEINWTEHNLKLNVLFIISLIGVTDFDQNTDQCEA